MTNKQRKVACETSRSGWRRSQTNSKIHKCQHSQTLPKTQILTVVLDWYRGSTLLKPTFPEDRNCEICLRTKMTRAPCRRRTATVVPRAENFGDLITADHKVLREGCESSICCCGTRIGNSMVTILHHAEQKSFTTDISLEFGNVCEDLSWNHCTSTTHRSETNGIAESGTQNSGRDVCCILSQSDLGEK